MMLVELSLRKAIMRSALWRHWVCKGEWSLVLPPILAGEGRQCDETIQEPCRNRGEWTGPSLSGEVHILPFPSTHPIFTGKLSGKSTPGAGGKSRSKVTALRAHLSGEHSSNLDSPAGPCTPWEVTALHRQDSLGRNFKPKNNNCTCILDKR